MMLRRDEYDVLDELRKTGALSHQLEDRHQKLRREQFFKAGLQADHYPPSTSSHLAPVDMTVTEWLKDKWISADASVRHSLQVLADALGIPLPLRRTLPIPAKPTTQVRRTRSARQPNVEQDPPESPAEEKERGYHDPPEWDDNDADGWTPSESLYDALHPDNDRGGWY